MTTQQLKTRVYLRSKRFRPSLDETDEESHRWNHELASFLADGLRSKGSSVADPFDDEHGHAMEIATDRFRVFVGCGPQGEEEDSFTAFVIPSEPTVRRWFRRVPTAPVVKPILEALDAVLADPAITNVRWELP